MELANGGSTCLSAFGKVKNGEYFTPIGKDVCETCKCVAGKAVGCISQTCLNLPSCAKYERLKGKCCQFQCLEGDGLSKKSELAVILSLSIGLLLLLIILITILCCRRQSNKKNKEQQPKTKTPSQMSNSTEQVQASNTESESQPSSNLNREGSNLNREASNVNRESNHEEQSQGATGIELPPPYFPPENIMAVNTRRAQQPLPPNEPPPPYDREESAV